LSTDVFRAVADPTRRTLLDRLRAGGRPAGELARAFSVSRPAISRHLRVLKEARLVVERREGRRRIYQLAPLPLGDIDAWLAEYRDFLRGSLERLKAHIESEAPPAGESD
jgi:DNA-binding transcriptional ArsR family regulator